MQGFVFQPVCVYKLQECALVQTAMYFHVSPAHST